jgi:hypothetical protein
MSSKKKDLVKGVKYSKKVSRCAWLYSRRPLTVVVNDQEVLQLFQAFLEFDTEKKGYFREADIDGRSSKVAKDAEDTVAASGRVVRPKLQTPVRGREVVRSMDVNQDGVVDWTDMLRTFFPNATERELKQMYLWAYPPKEPEVEVEFQISSAQLDEIKMIFNLNDKNKDGRIDVREFKEYCKESGYDMDEVAVLFDQSDVNGDGWLSFDEFLEMIKGAYMPLDYDLAY